MYQSSRKHDYGTLIQRLPIVPQLLPLLSSRRERVRKGKGIAKKQRRELAFVTGMVDRAAVMREFVRRFRLD